MRSIVRIISGALLLFVFSCSTKVLTSKPQVAQVAEQVSEIVPRRAEVLFLGNTSKHHDSYKYAPMLASAVFKSGINITYTDELSDLNTENLAKYDALVIYANYDTIGKAEENALRAFVEGGKGLVPLHCASYCFRNSDWYVKAVGGQFKTHTTGKFPAVIVDSKHPVMKDISAFETWDETYVHDKINPDKTVLTERVEGDHHEPYTWVRQQGSGRVFYTAYGHNDSTWTNKEFLKLVKNGIFWALGDKVISQVNALQVPQGTYTDAKIPNYEKRDPAPKFQAPFSSAESQKLIQVPVDFKIELFAAEPDIINPIAMAWDERGRLWVIETIDYPNEIRTDDGTGVDRIKICEDTDGDGKADKFTIFADKLNIPTSIVFANGGVIVAQAPDFIFLKDTNGDDKADVREKIITGWGKSDTHAGPSNLKYGFDNKIWGVLGYSGFSGAIGGKQMKFGQGVYNFTADGKQLEFLGATSNNTWGLGFSEENDVFISTANNTHSAFFGLPARYAVESTGTKTDQQSVKKLDGHYDMHVVFPNLRQVDVFGGFTAAAGHNLYTARNYPKNYWNRIAFVCEPTGRVVHQAILKQDGAGFTEADGWNFVASADEWVGPVQAEVGPDGAVWVADWYDFIIQHNPTPRGFENGKGNAYINPLRDHDKGRIYRIVYKNAKPYTPIKLSKNDIPGLLKALENDNMFWRMTAQRLLVEANNAEAIPGLLNTINSKQQDELGLSGAAVHALWVLKGIGAINDNNAQVMPSVYAALKHPAAAVRKAAVQVLPVSNAALQEIVKANLLSDADGRVRAASILVLADHAANAEIGSMIYGAANDEGNIKDEWISKALQAAAVKHKAGYLAAYTKKSASAGTLNKSIYNTIRQTGKSGNSAIAKKSTSALPAITINLKVVEHVMQFDKKLITVKAGQKVILNFENPDFMQHNWVLIKAGTTSIVGAAADELARDPKGADKNYVPQIPEVLKASALLNPQQKVTIEFTAPEQPGSYPYLCTFPGHWRIMNGILKVTK
ncbi:ThuA domain-containing protein [Mucilaginibacter sp. JRF]|uniref:PVC-type heme-binding CxxCH protein n=1 Tax=Mucilaginibacter sp. JRF TaxID=2780088 RepID=UPI00187DDF17|nr:PVC-type heme-binding CxxCH protein [Mucilaginibacter sp. JRF]MBE9583149.1 ThuA domain-containing protein [Mucilaginibacter sp. JRF]